MSIEAQPVAWRWKERINNDLESWVITASEPPPYAIEKQPLYAAPPKRESLTDQEIGEALAAVLLTQRSGSIFFPFARAIEAAHGIGEKA